VTSSPAKLTVVRKKTYVSTANGNLRLPTDAYSVKGNVVEVRRPRRALGDVKKVGPLSAELVPHWGQKPIWYDTKTPNLILLAGSQGGKSHIGPHWLWREIEKKVNEGPPGTEYLFGIVGPTLQMMRQATVGIARMVRFLCAKFKVSEETILNKQDLRIDLRPIGYNVQIYAGSAERRHRLQGARLEAAWIDEGGQVRDPAIYHITNQRLHGEGRLLVTTTPYMAGASWLTEIIKKAEKGEDEDTLVVRFPSIVNPYFSLEEEARLARLLPRWYFNMMYNAEFEKPQGQVYPDVTYIDPVEIPAHWPRFIGVDPTHGGKDKFAAVWLTYDPFEPEVWYVYREFYLACTPDITSPDQRWRSPHEMLDAIYAMSMVEKWDEDEGAFVATEERENIGRIFVDPSKKETLYDVQARFTEAQVYAADAKLAGLIEVGSLLKSAHLLPFNNLIHWAFEQGQYIYPFDEFGEAIGEVPMDRHNHLMDATRYAVRQCDDARSLAEPSFG
jgi:hypothetical protein